MALVAYDDSDSGEEATDDRNLNPSMSKSQSGPLKGLLASLPRPKDDCTKRMKKPVKIAMPTAPEPDSDEDSETPVVAAMKSSDVRKGISSLLPAPKMKRQSLIVEARSLNPNIPTVKEAGRILVPHTVAAKKAAAEKTAAMRAKAAKKASKEKSKQSDDSNDEDESPTSFFSFDCTTSSLDSQTEVRHNEVAGPALGPQLPSTEEAQYAYDQYPHYGQVMDDAGSMGYSSAGDQNWQCTATGLDHASADTSNSQTMLQDEAFQQLNCGKKRKRKGAWDIAQIIDVNEKDTIAEIHEYRKKMASQEDSNYIPPVKTNFIRIPSSDARRKHQITWLALEAREREMKLQNQWAESRLTKRQTQAKYGW
ncbi:proline-rich protein PRCC-like [Corticium candelabrum]|uniref:proline-rich protein PRCC-like n=1 Tax=Corticium candelabrum TaxID=121492 RepID=UPI002E260952|nr:proline-rich protein PRCC-like [Corticium candelabrum]